MIKTYINQLKQELITGNALEHSYRPALKNLIESLDTAIRAVNEPSRSEHGAPDFIFLNKTNVNLILGYAETKDINVDLNQIEKSEQLKRYLGYSNLILTNYLEFRFFRNGEKYQTIVVAKQVGSNIIVIEENFSLLERELKSFLEGKPETITNGKRLAKIMGGKAARIRANVINFLQTENDKNQELLRIYKVMQKLLIHDLEIDKFADMYAQTLVYGLFIARYYDKTPDNFSRQEARDLIPASNPFLQHFFDHIAGSNFDKRLTYIVDELCDVFSVSDVQTIIKKHYNLLGEVTDKDPIIHFYEDFLKEYDPLLRKQMGAYYTPVPVVQFIIHAVDHVLKTEFNLPEGLASTDKIEHQIVIQGNKAKLNLHKVQILDPAVGTATFLNESIKFIYAKFKGQEGLWESYVEKELLPRMYGFELMMAPYTIAHLKLAMTLKETGIDHFDRRLGIYLTNTLEEGVKVSEDLFNVGLAEAISEEAQAANDIKRDRPIMVVIGNPPYSGESFNKGAYAMKLVEKYKFEPGGKEKLRERNPKWINDDYVKFIAFAQEMISKTGEGIVSMITNHGYLDNPTFRGMRWNLTKTFSAIYILDLHGNAKKKEVAPDGGKDENVFDIQQGVAIIVAIKHKTDNKGLADVFRADIWGKRETKFEFLLQNTLSDIKWEKIRLNEPSYIFLNKDENLDKEYKKGIKVSELFPLNSVGIVTARDDMSIQTNKDSINNVINDFINLDIESLRSKYNLGHDVRDWSVGRAKLDVIAHPNDNNVAEIAYRPFDIRYTFYTGSSRGFHCYPRNNIMQMFLTRNNIGLMICRQQKTEGFHHVLVHKDIVESGYVSNKTSEIGSSFPLYLYQNNNQAGLFNNSKRQPNLNMGWVQHLLTNLGKYSWIDDHENKKLGDINTVSPLDILDYVYATLHSPTYRERYKDFLKADFPRVPSPKDKNSFWELVKLGGKLRQLHLMESQELSNLKTSFSVTGDNLVENVEYRGDKVYINDSQYFGNVSKEAWGFYIGGYQPAQKWLKDRKGKKLTYEDITHYQKIILAQIKTIEIQKKIDSLYL